MSSDEPNHTPRHEGQAAEEAYQAFAAARERFVAKLVFSVLADPTASDVLEKALMARVPLLRVLYVLRQGRGDTAPFYSGTTLPARMIAVELDFVDFDDRGRYALTARGAREIKRWIDYMHVLRGNSRLQAHWRRVVAV